MMTTIANCDGVSVDDNIVLIWDTGEATKHLFEFIPPGGYRVLRKKHHVLLGGSTDHSVKTSTVFDVGYLSGVLLLPPDVRIGYNIFSAGQLTHLRTVQNSDGTFYVLAIDGSIISRGRLVVTVFST
jgi:hypothetical protein